MKKTLKQRQMPMKFWPDPLYEQVLHMYVQIVVVPLFRFMIRSYSSAITAIEENKTARCGISNTETHKTVCLLYCEALVIRIFQSKYTWCNHLGTIQILRNHWLGGFRKWLFLLTISKYITARKTFSRQIFRCIWQLNIYI